MRTRLLSISLIGALSGCAAETVERPAPPPVDWRSLEQRSAPVAPDRTAATLQERAVAGAWAKAMDSPDFAGLAPLLDEEVHFRFAAARDVHGRDEVIQAHRALLGAYERRHFQLTRVLMTDSSQVLEWTASAVDKGTKKPVAWKGLTLLWTRDDGSIADCHLYYDEAVLEAQVGKGPGEFPGPPPVPAIPGGAIEEVEQRRTGDESAEVATVRAALQALEDGDEAAYLNAFADDVEVSTLEKAEPARGKASEKAGFKAMRGAIGYLATSVENRWGVGRYVVVEYQIVGEQRRPIGWIPMHKGSLIKHVIVDVIDMRGGRIARVSRYDDPIQIAAPL